MAWEIAKADHIGGREEQQDRAAAFRADGGAVCLLAVADGMGGHAGGATAAQAVVDSALDAWQAVRHPVRDPEAFLRGICADAHGRINRVGAKAGLAPRSACAMLYATEAGASWLSVGDTRLYHFRNGKLLSRSRDQSVVQMLVDMGKIAESEMADHPDQGRLLQSVGGEQAPDPEAGRTDLGGNDAFLLCSDGLWESMAVREMALGLAEPSLSAAAEALVRLAAERGGPAGDNVSVAMGRALRHRGASQRLMSGLLALALVLAAGVSLWVLLA
ncbi:MAG: serine/threonine-protein phosphatase [Alphaproteobacteria bacterium]|nr:serine/threonine-protein phosphatase [Alphaproteobacteria bacterium]